MTPQKTPLFEDFKFKKGYKTKKPVCRQAGIPIFLFRKKKSFPLEYPITLDISYFYLNIAIEINNTTSLCCLKKAGQ
jgi:hypothetical protein